mmetsp:Transcript_50476/g.93238  ORF Transcript_50476/g.93238 Transcript_50476/m.93238 type:complete len:291 (-) Transcript_50476:573-1445(-)
MVRLTMAVRIKSVQIFSEAAFTGDAGWNASRCSTFASCACSSRFLLAFTVLQWLVCHRHRHRSQPALVLVEGSWLATLITKTLEYWSVHLLDKLSQLIVIHVVTHPCWLVLLLRLQLRNIAKIYRSWHFGLKKAKALRKLSVQIRHVYPTIHTLEEVLRLSAGVKHLLGNVSGQAPSTFSQLPIIPLWNVRWRRLTSRAPESVRQYANASPGVHCVHPAAESYAMLRQFWGCLLLARIKREILSLTMRARHAGALQKVLMLPLKEACLEAPHADVVRAGLPHDLYSKPWQ